MYPWVAAVSIAVLVTTVPLCWVYRVLEGLPAPIARSHPHWPYPINLAIILAATVTASVFIRGLYYSGSGLSDPALAALRFLIAAPVYILAFVLLIRQYLGLYPEFFVASGPGGFTVRKRSYRNVVRLEERRQLGDETEVLFYMKIRERLILAVPVRDLERLYELIRPDESGV